VDESSNFNPFPGWRPFDVDDAVRFFGREQLIDQLLRRLRQRRLLILIGESASGKSSLVQAGLLPALYSGFMSGAGSRWRTVIMRPGRSPVQNLASALADSDLTGEGRRHGTPVGDAREIDASLRSGSLSLTAVIRDSDLKPSENVVLVVDQFEELFRSFGIDRRGTEETWMFVKLLLNASASDVPIYVVLTMRADFVGECVKVPALAEAVNETLFLVPCMKREQLRSAIEGPVALHDGAVDAALLHRLLNDAGDSPDQLPILQHVLMRMWNVAVRRQDRSTSLRLTDYLEVGGMTNALELHLEETLGELDDRGRAVAAAVFKALSERDHDGRLFRRPATLAELSDITGVGQADIVRVVDAFRRPGRAFLMPLGDVVLGPESVIDLSHEALMRKWSRLAMWLREEAEASTTYRRIAESALLYQRGLAALLADPELSIALAWRMGTQPTAAWAVRYHPEFAAALAYLDDSLEHRDRERAAVEKQRMRLKQRTVWVMLATSGITAFAILILMWLSGAGGR
jgi:hypothetical protein